MIFIFDFDGCISICDWRECHIPNWEEFHRLLPYDPPNHTIIQMMDDIYEDGHHIVILTGRMEDNREASEKWLDKHDVKYHAMIMRPLGCTTPSEDWKQSVVESNFKKEDIAMIFDDRAKIIKRFKELGYPVHKVKVTL